MKELFKYRNVRSYCLFIVMLILLNSCEKLVAVDPPPTSLNGDNIYENDATAIAAVTGMYANIASAGINQGPLSVSLFTGLSGDELTLYNAVQSIPYRPFYTNTLTNSNLSYADFWQIFYSYIYTCNAAIKGINNTKGMSDPVKQQLLGEIHFVRAWCYFYLVNLFGDVPLVTGTDYTVNAALKREPKDNVWELIISDLITAKDALSENYLDATLHTITQERVRPTKWAAWALLSRTYLYMGNWAAAEEAATAVIEHMDQYGMADIGDAFVANNKEAIWQLQPVNLYENTSDARLFILPSTGPSQFSNPVYLSEELMDSFEPNDLRRKNWVDSVVADGIVYHFAYKYKVNDPSAPLSEYEVILRLAEQYLIRAEAMSQEGKLSTAVADLNVIRTRAGLPAYTQPLQKENILAAILKERRIELFTEAGHRWLDLKRLNKVDEVMTTVAQRKGGTWNSNWQWYPISINDIRRGINLVQNKGY